MSVQQIPPPDFLQVGYKNGEIPFISLGTIPNSGGQLLHKEALANLLDMQAAASAAGNPFTVSSGYRTYSKQKCLYDNRSRDGAVAPPGESNHGWGIAIDIRELYAYVGGKTDAEITRVARERSSLYVWLNNNAAKYGFAQPSELKDGGEIDELWHWQYGGWNVPELKKQRISVREGEDNKGTDTCADENSQYTLGGGTPIYGYPNQSTYISPYIGSTDSFHPNIQFELSRRRVSDETITTHIPFVKLTSLSNVLPNNLPDDISTAHCPSLGVHGQTTVSFDDIYHPMSNRSIVGYATTPEGSPVKVLVDAEAAESTDAPNIPMPGIISMTAERSTAGPMGVRGGLLKANLKIVAYSVGQLDVLMRYFLRPATRVVLEIGRSSSSTTESPITPFDWNRGEASIVDELRSIVTLNSEAGRDVEQPQYQFLKKYTYNNFGNYEIFVAYVVTNKIKYSKNNTYEIDLTLHSVQQFEIPVKITGAQTLCASSVANTCNPIDIEDYFNSDSKFRQSSFEAVLDRASNIETDLGKTWDGHVIPLRNVGADNNNAGTQLPGYLISWKFFLSEILHNEVHGIMSIFGHSAQDTQAKEYIKKSLPPLVWDEYVPTDTSLVSNEVSYHKFLRSTNAGVMVIINPAAQSQDEEFKRALRAYSQRLTTVQRGDARAEDGSVLFGTDARGQQISGNNLADDTVKNLIEKASQENFVGQFTQVNGSTLPVALLSRGILINSNAIREAFMSTDTLAAGLSKLLTSMNLAVEGFWNLQLYSVDGANPGVHIIDAGLSKPVRKELLPSSVDIIPNITDISAPDVSQFGANDTPTYLYLFNRKLSAVNDRFTGSELLDINLELALPQVIAVQAIAGVGGVAQRGTLEAIDIDELTRITLFKDLYPSCADVPCPDSTGGRTQLCGADYSRLADPTNFLNAGDVEAVAAVYLNPNSTNQQRQQAIDDLKERVNAQLLDRQTETGIDRNRIVGQYRISREQADSMFAKLERDLLSEYELRNTGFISLIRQYGNTLGKAIKFIEYDKTSLLQKLDDDREDPARNGVHPFNSSNLTKTVVDLTMPGIGGIQLFQAFAVDRVPNILNSGYYVVTKVVHDFNVQNGWVTKIQGRFRAKPKRPATVDDSPCPPTPYSTSRAAGIQPTPIIR